MPLKRAKLVLMQDKNLGKLAGSMGLWPKNMASIRVARAMLAIWPISRIEATAPEAAP